jgi:hypothetical protein
MYKTNKYLILGLCVFILAGCQEIYRYPCQDPARKHEYQCKPEVCEETRTCPKI